MTTGTITVRRFASGVITPITRIPAHLTGITAPPGFRKGSSSALDRGMDGAGGMATAVMAGAVADRVVAIGTMTDTEAIEAGLKDVAAMVDAFPTAATESAVAMVALHAALTVAAA